MTGDSVPDVVAVMSGENGVFVFGRDPATTLKNVASYDLDNVTLPPGVLTAPQQPFVVSIGDATGDGAADILVPMQVTIHAGGTTGGWELIPTNPLSPTVSGVFPGTHGTIGFDARAADFLYTTVPDGRPDVILTENGGLGLTLFQGQAGGALLPAGAPSIAPIRPTQTALVDLDGDGHIDIVVGDGDRTSGQLVVFYNGGVEPTNPVSPVVGAPALFLGYGTFDFANPVLIDLKSLKPLPTSVGVSSLAVIADQLGGPGPRDPLVGTASATGASTQLIDVAQGDLSKVVLGTWVHKTGTPIRARVTGVSGTTLTITDLGVNAFQAGDAYRIEPLLDIVFAGVISPYMGVLFQTTPRVLNLVGLTTGSSPGQVDTGDLDADGLIDIACPWLQEGKLAIYYQNNDAPTTTYRGPVLYPTSSSPVGCTILDVDGDTKNDVVVSSRAANSLNVFFQR